MLARRTPLRRSAALARQAPLRRTRCRRTPVPVRDWTAALAKRDREGRCRVCGAEPGPDVTLEAAHTVGRSHDRLDPVRGVLVVAAVDTVPLCVQPDGGCHGRFDRRQLDLLPYLSPDEQAAAVRHVGLVAALRRLTGERGGGSWEEWLGGRAGGR